MFRTRMPKKGTETVVDGGTIATCASATPIYRDYDLCDDETLIETIKSRSKKGKLNPRLKQRHQWISHLQKLDRIADEIHATNKPSSSSRIEGAAIVNTQSQIPGVSNTAAPPKRKRLSTEEGVPRKRLKNTDKHTARRLRPVVPNIVEHDTLDKMHNETVNLAQALNVLAAPDKLVKHSSGAHIGTPVHREQPTPPEQDVRMTDVEDAAHTIADERAQLVEDHVGLHIANQTSNEGTADVQLAASNKSDLRSQAGRQQDQETIKPSKAASKVNQKVVQKSNIYLNKQLEAVAAMEKGTAVMDDSGSAKESVYLPDKTSNEHLGDEDVVQQQSPRRSRRLVQDTVFKATQEKLAHQDIAGKESVEGRREDDASNNEVDASIATLQHPTAVLLDGTSERINRSNTPSSTAPDSSNLNEDQRPPKKRRNPKGHYVTTDHLWVPPPGMDERLDRSRMGSWAQFALMDREEERRRQAAIREGRPYEPPKYPKPYDWRDEFKDGMR